MKNERQEKILAIIAASAIETQEQLIDSLREAKLILLHGFSQLFSAFETPQ